MKTSILTIPFIAAILCGCSTLPQQYSASPTRSLVQGVSAKDTSVQIRSVDGGDIVYVRSGHIGGRVWLEPGIHKVSVTCSTEEKAGLYTVDAEVEVDVQPGYTYILTASPFKGVGTPHVEVTKKECKS
jgi:hypothetical protein